MKVCINAADITTDPYQYRGCYTRIISEVKVLSGHLYSLFFLFFKARFARPSSVCPLSARHELVSPETETREAKHPHVLPSHLCTV